MFSQHSYFLQYTKFYDKRKEYTGQYSEVTGD